MLARVFSCAVIGLDGVIVEVEVDTGPGLPAMTIVGLPDTDVQESRERVDQADRHDAGDGDDDDLDLNTLDDDELTEQVYDDLYNGLRDEVMEATRILLARGEDGTLCIEAHPREEFPGQDPATALPAANWRFASVTHLCDLKCGRSLAVR